MKALVNPNATDFEGHPLATQDEANLHLIPMMFGWNLQIFLTGIVIVLFFNYCQRGAYSRDPQATRLITLGVILLNFFAFGIAWAETVRWGSTQERGIDDLHESIWIDTMQPILIWLLSGICQVFYTRRALRLMKNATYKATFVSIFVLLMVLTSLSAVATTVWQALFIYERADEMLPFNFVSISMSWLLSQAAIDLMISITLCVLLRGYVSGFQQGSADRALKGLMKLALETAIYTAFSSLTAAFATVGLRDQGEGGAAGFVTATVPFTFSLPLPALYTLAFLVNLTARERLSLRDSHPPQLSNLSLDAADSEPGGIISRAFEAIAGRSQRPPTIQSVMRSSRPDLGPPSVALIGGQNLTKKETRGTTASFFTIDVDVEVEESAEDHVASKMAQEKLTRSDELRRQRTKEEYS